MDHSDAWDAAATAADALNDLQATDLWAYLPVETRRALCAARVHCQALTAALEQEAA
jgi:hypothetical protein